MAASYEQSAAHNAVVRAALRCVAAEFYADDANPHADAEAEHAGELLALAARELVRAVDALPESEQPIGWQEQPEMRLAPTDDAADLPTPKKPARKYRFLGDVMSAPHDEPQF